MLTPNEPTTYPIDRDQIDQVRINGYTVLSSVFDPALLARIAADAEGETPFLEIIEHPALLSLVRAILGDDPVIGWFGYSSGMPVLDDAKDDRRLDPVHSDSPWLFPEAQLGLPPFALAVSVPLLSDLDERSGATRLWTGGTHMAMSPVDVERMAETMSSVQPVVRVGDLLLRDLRTWHGYAPNRSGVPCPVVQIVYTRPWYRVTVVPPPRLTRHRFDSLTDGAKRLFRYANIVDTEPA